MSLRGILRGTSKYLRILEHSVGSPLYLTNTRLISSLNNANLHVSLNLARYKREGVAWQVSTLNKQSFKVDKHFISGGSQIYFCSNDMKNGDHSRQAGLGDNSKTSSKQDKQTNRNMSSPYWDYSRDYGPDKWHINWQLGDNQSPVDLNLREIEYDQQLVTNRLEFSKEGAIHLDLKNTGMTLAWQPTEANLKLPQLTNGPLEGKYEFKEFHFHWGKVDDFGSEHLIDSRSFSAEIHLVHWNKTLYDSFEQAKASKNGLAVLGVFLEKCDNGNPVLDTLIESFKHVSYKGSKTTLPSPFDPYTLLPANRSDYWTYKGSLTTPPCTENVTWIVFPKTFPISVNQLNGFRSVKAIESGNCNECSFHDPMGRKSADVIHAQPTIGDNYRPPMPLNNRTIRASFTKKPA